MTKGSWIFSRRKISSAFAFASAGKFRCKSTSGIRNSERRQKREMMIDGVIVAARTNQ